MKHPVNINENYDTSNLYRMPWSKADNSNAWLSITRACNITCEYCVQEHARQTHKRLKEIEFELKELLKLRNCDTIQIAGGEPLIHPQLIEIVKLVKLQKKKPFLITNGVGLDEKLLRELKKAGLFGFILHIDSGQERPGWEGKSEIELNELRQQYADMIKKTGGLVCSFITTITPKALNQVREIVKWCRINNDRVVQNIFVPVRGFHINDPWHYRVDGKEIDMGISALCNAEAYDNLSAKDLANEVKKAIPEYEFSAFCGGTQVSSSPKWLFGLYAATKNKFIGNVGKGGMEAIQSLHHLFLGRYVSFLKPWIYRNAWMTFFLFFFDKGIRKILGKRLLSFITNPFQIFKKLRLQAMIVMQPFDILPNGETDMCDSCPNMTYWDGRLVPECRMEEYINYGKLIQFELKKDEIITPKCSEKEHRSSKSLIVEDLGKG